MPFILVNSGKLNWINRVVASPTYAVHLYQDDITIDRDSIAPDFTAVEADYDGYADQNATGWTAGVINAGNAGESTADAQTYTCTGDTTPNTIYGYYILDDTGALVGAERFVGSGYEMAFAGQSIVLTPKLTMKSEFSN